LLKLFVALPGESLSARAESDQRRAQGKGFSLVYPFLWDEIRSLSTTLRWIRSFSEIWTKFVRPRPPYGGYVCYLKFHVGAALVIIRVPAERLLSE
ncbi:MAG: hypothetical protein IJ391_04600, partial [Clostridia bacterium]|nr:hypothetical protein [Clostridia bacterium]